MQGPTRRGTARKPAKPGPAALRARSAGAKPEARKAKPAKAATKEPVRAPRKAAAKEVAELRAKAPGKAKEKAPKPAKKRTEPLNFRVTPEFRRAFKRAAAAQDCKKVELLERAFAEWSARNPGPA